MSGEIDPHRGSENTRDRHAADAAERGAERLAAEAVQEQEGGRRRQRDEHDRDHDRLRAAQDHGYLNEPDARKRIHKPQQGREALFPADQQEQRRKHGKQADQNRRAVIIRNGYDIRRALVVQIEADDDLCADLRVDVGIDGQIVDRLKRFALPRAVQDLDLKILLADAAALGPVLGFRIVVQNVRDARNGEKPLARGSRLAVRLRVFQNQRPRDDQHEQQRAHADLQPALARQLAL